MTTKLRNIRATALAALLITMGLNDIQAQDRRRSDAPAQEPTKPPTPAAPATPPKTGIKPYKEVITDKATTDVGLFKVHRLDGNISTRFLIPYLIAKCSW